MMVLGITTYSEIHIRHHVLISGKLQYAATIWSWRCWMSQIVLHTVSSTSLLNRVLMICFKLSAVLFKKSIPYPFPWGAVGRTEWDQQNRGAASLHGYRKYNVWQLQVHYVDEKVGAESDNDVVSDASNTVLFLGLWMRRWTPLQISRVANATAGHTWWPTLSANLRN